MFHCEIYFRIHFSRYLRQMPWTNSRGPSIKKRPSYPLQSARLGLKFHFIRNQEGAEWGLQATTKMMSKWVWYLKKKPQKPWSSHLFPHWGGQFGGSSPILQACVFNVGSWRSCTPKMLTFLYHESIASWMDCYWFVQQNRNSPNKSNLLKTPETRVW